MESAEHTLNALNAERGNKKMTNEEKFRQDKVFYKHEKYGYILELWGASTKHPDSVFYFEDFQKNEIFTDEEQLFQWICECASKLAFPPHAVSLIEWGLEHFINN